MENHSRLLLFQANHYRSGCGIDSNRSQRADDAQVLFARRTSEGNGSIIEHTVCGQGECPVPSFLLQLREQRRAGTSTFYSPCIPPSLVMNSSNTSSSFSLNSLLHFLAMPFPPSPPPFFWTRRITTNLFSPIPKCPFLPFQLFGTRLEHERKIQPRLSRKSRILIFIHGPNPMHLHWVFKINPTRFLLHLIPFVKIITFFNPTFRNTIPTIPSSPISTISTTSRLERKNQTMITVFTAVFRIHVIVQQTSRITQA